MLRACLCQKVACRQVLISCAGVQNYNQTRHEFEIHLENASQVEPCPEEAEEIPQIQYHVSLWFCRAALGSSGVEYQCNESLPSLCLPASHLTKCGTRAIDLLLYSLHVNNSCQRGFIKKEINVYAVGRSSRISHSLIGGKCAS